MAAVTAFPANPVCVHVYRLGYSEQGPVQAVVSNMEQVPWWLKLYLKLAKVDCDWSSPRVHIDNLEYIDFYRWELRLPYLPAINLDTLFGFRAVHVVFRVCGTDLVRVVVQRRSRCSVLQHPDPPTIRMHEYDDIARLFMVNA
jgi:hypothetical protein